MSIFTQSATFLLFCLTAATRVSAQAPAPPASASPAAATAAPVASVPAIPDFKTGVARKRYLFPQKEAQGTNVLNVTKNTDEDAEKDGTYTRLSYLPYPLMLTQLDEMRKIYYWADSTYQRRLTALPAGGALQLTIYRRGAANADPSLLVLQALTKGGQEVWRAAPRAGNGRFWNRDLYKAEQQMSFVKSADNQPLTVKIYDPRQGQTYEYVVQMP
ncbi:hypothetical protein [uncultured Hymenobacter sp.]|uniref:hypothetical protein n=1 Tax=uncultured Hymenobacter sp. TaxID=170016 RepID=UPI0035C97D9B